MSPRDRFSPKNIDRELADRVADGHVSADDAATVREFWAFLEDPEVGPASAKTPLPMSVLRRYQDLLGLTDEDLAQAERNRAAVAGHPAEEVGA